MEADQYRCKYLNKVDVRTGGLIPLAKSQMTITINILSHASDILSAAHAAHIGAQRRISASLFRIVGFTASGNQVP
jgi:hypothetical protein